MIAVVTRVVVVVSACWPSGSVNVCNRGLVGSKRRHSFSTQVRENADVLSISVAMEENAARLGRRFGQQLQREQELRAKVRGLRAAHLNRIACPSAQQ